MTIKNSLGKCSLFLFYQPMDEKIKTWLLRLPAKENPNMEKALFDWPIVLQYDVKAKYQLISRRFSRMKFFHPSVRLNNQTPRTPACPPEHKFFPAGSYFRLPATFLILVDLWSLPIKEIINLQMWCNSIKSTYTIKNWGPFYRTMVVLPGQTTLTDWSGT